MATVPVYDPDSHALPLVVPETGAFAWFSARQPQQIRRVPLFCPTLIRVVAGEKTLWMAGKRWSAGAQTLLVLGAGTEVDLVNRPALDSGRYLAEVLSLAPVMLERLRLHYPDVTARLLAEPPVLRPLCPLGESLRQAWERLWARVRLPGTPSALLQHGVAEVLLCLTLAGGGQALFMTESGGWSQRVLALLQLEPDRAWCAAELAGRLHCSAATLRRRLAEENTSYRALLEDARLGLALGLLQTSTASIGMIAQRCGYESPSRFSVRFRQRFGLSPRDLRATLSG